MRTFGFALVLALAPLPFLYGSRTTAPSNDPAAPANGGGLVLCDGQAHALRFLLKPGGKVERDFWIENRSDKPIIIASVKSSCDCLTLVEPSVSLAVNESERIKFRIAVDLSKDPRYIGGFAPELVIQSNVNDFYFRQAFDIEVEP